MPTTTLYPAVTSVGTSGGVTVTPTLVGAANNNAAMDASNASYLQYAAGVLADQPRIVCSFTNVTSGLPAGAVITGMAVQWQFSSATPAVNRYFAPYRMWCVSDTSQVTYFPLSLSFLENGTFQTFTSQTFQRNNSGASSYYSTLLANTATDDVWVDMAMANSAASGGICRLATVALIITYNVLPTVSAFNPTDLSAGNTFSTQPTYGWTYADADTDAQSAYEIFVWQTSAKDSSGIPVGSTGFNPRSKGYLATSGKVSSSATTWTCTTPIANTTICKAYIYVYQSTAARGSATGVLGTSSNHTITVTPPPVLAGIGSLTESAIQTTRLFFRDNALTPTTIYNQSIEIERSLDAGVTWSNIYNGPTIAVGMYVGNNTTLYASTPDAAVLDITGNVELQAHSLRISNLTATSTIMGKWDAVGVQRSYQWYINTSGNVVFQWSYDGTNTVTATSTASISALIPYGESRPIHLRVLPSTATTSYSVSFWYSIQEVDTPTTWTQLGSTITGTSASAGIFAGTAALRVGSLVNPVASFVGLIGRTLIYNGSGSLVSYADFNSTLPTAGTTFVASTGETWTYAGTTRAIRGYMYRDSTAPSGILATYRARGTGYTAPSYISTAWSASVTNTITLTGFWLRAPDLPDFNVAIDLYDNSLDFEVPKEHAIYKPLDLSRFVAISDGTRGLEGTLKIKVSTLAAREALRALYDADVPVQLIGSAADWTTGRTFFLKRWRQRMEDLQNQYWAIDLDVVEVTA